MRTQERAQLQGTKSRTGIDFFFAMLRSKVKDESNEPKRHSELVTQHGVELLRRCTPLLCGLIGSLRKVGGQRGLCLWGQPFPRKCGKFSFFGYSPLRHYGYVPSPFTFKSIFYEKQNKTKKPKGDSCRYYTQHTNGIELYMTSNDIQMSTVLDGRWTELNLNNDSQRLV